MNKLLTSARNSRQLLNTASSGAKRKTGEGEGRLLSSESGKDMADRLLSSESGKDMAGRLLSSESGRDMAGGPLSSESGKDMAGRLLSSESGSSMAVRAVYFAVDSRRPGAVFEKVREAVLALRSAGFRSGILCGRSAAAGDSPAQGGWALPSGQELQPAGVTVSLREAEEHPGDCLLLCDSGALAGALSARGLYTAGFSHEFNRGESFPGTSYVVEDPEQVEPEGYERIWRRAAGLPWTILRTENCLVREFTASDLDAIYALYDEDALRYLTPPSGDRAREEKILRAYIDRVYGLYGFGHWAVEAGSGGISADGRGPFVPAGTLIGRIGFSVLTADQEREAVRMGVRAGRSLSGTVLPLKAFPEKAQPAGEGKPQKEESAPGEGSGIDADFGFLMAASCRGRGLAYEVCSALLKYGFRELGFSRVRADARVDNTASGALLGRLGFSPAGIVRAEGAAKRVYILDV